MIFICKDVKNTKKLKYFLYICCLYPIISFTNKNKNKNKNKKMNINNECCICLEMIQQINSCITPCGHSFCFTCMVKNLDMSNSCPYCRTILKESVISEINQVSEDEEDYTTEEDNEDDENESEGESVDEDPYANCRTNAIEILVEKVENKGYTIMDILSYCFDLYSNKNVKYTKEFIDTLEKDMDNLYNESHIQSNAIAIEREYMQDEDIDVAVGEEE